MNTLEAVRYLQDHYWEIDLHDQYGQMLGDFLRPGTPAESLFEFLMQPEEECFEEYANSEWTAMVSAETNPVEASWLILEWFCTRKWAHLDGKTMRGYMASKAEHEEYECPPRRKFERQDSSQKK